MLTLNETSITYLKKRCRIKIGNLLESNIFCSIFKTYIYGIGIYLRLLKTKKFQSLPSLMIWKFSISIFHIVFLFSGELYTFYKLYHLSLIFFSHIWKDGKDLNIFLERNSTLCHIDRSALVVLNTE